MVNVEVEDEHAGHAGLLEHPFGHAGDGVEEAEAHGLEALGVMAGRAGHHEGARAAQHARGCGERGAYGRARGGEALRGNGIVQRVKQPRAHAAGVFELALVVGGMDLGDDAIGIGMLGRLAHHPIGQSRADDPFGEEHTTRSG